MTSFYEASTSGLNWDRFTDLDSLFGDSTKLKVKQAYWTAKQLFREKLGKKEDEHVLAADADLDLHLQTFRRVRDSSSALLREVEAQQREVGSNLATGHIRSQLHELAQLELDTAEFLSDAHNGEKPHLQRVLQLTLNAQAYTAKRRQKLLAVVTRFCFALDEFIERAVLDCEQTVEAIDRTRLEYRGSLLWMKKCSDMLDPGDSSQMEDFRTVQQVVKANKRRLDQLKEDLATKVQLLHEARNKVLQECLEEYRPALATFFTDTAAEYCACADEMGALESYEIDLLKILNDPIGVALEEQRSAKQQQCASRGAKTQRQHLQSEEEAKDLVDLEDIELGAEVSEPMDRVRELLRFDDEEESAEGWGQTLADLGEGEVAMRTPTRGAPFGLSLLKHADELSGLLNWGLEEPRGGTEQHSRPQQKCDTKEPGTAENARAGGALLQEVDDLLFGEGIFDAGPSGGSAASVGSPHKKKGVLLRTESDSPLAILDETAAEADKRPFDLLEPVREELQGNVPKRAQNEVPRLAPPPKQLINSVAKSKSREIDQKVELIDELNKVFLEEADSEPDELFEDAR